MMLKNVIRDMKNVVKYEHPAINICMLSSYIVFLTASIRCGEIYRFVFLAYSVIGYILGAAMGESGCVSDYMIPFSDAERKKYHITKCAFCSVTVSCLLLQAVCVRYSLADKVLQGKISFWCS